MGELYLFMKHLISTAEIQSVQSAARGECLPSAATLRLAYYYASSAYQQNS